MNQGASTLALLALFFGALALAAISAFVLTRQIERLGARLRFTPGLLGIVVALASDSPEISSAITALAAGRRDLGVGVVLGSNVFNLAALLGVTALVTRQGVVVERRGLLMSGGTAIVVVLAGTLLVIQWLPAWAALGLAALVLVPYVVASSLHTRVLESLPLPAGVRASVCGAVENAGRDARPAHTGESGGLVEGLAVIPALAAVIGGSVVVVKGAVLLGGRWGVPQAITGVLVLAALTGVPNLIAAVDLARQGRGTAVVSETLNSNSLNIVFGLCLPAVLMGADAPSTTGKIALGWMVGMSVVALVLLGRGGGLHRKGGAALLALYAAFVIAVMLV